MLLVYTLRAADHQSQVEVDHRALLTQRTLGICTRDRTRRGSNESQPRVANEMDRRVMANCGSLHASPGVHSSFRTSCGLCVYFCRCIEFCIERLIVDVRRREHVHRGGMMTLAVVRHDGRCSGKGASVRHTSDERMRCNHDGLKMRRQSAPVGRIHRRRASSQSYQHSNSASPTGQPCQAQQCAHSSTHLPLIGRYSNVHTSGRCSRLFLTGRWDVSTVK
jgi:hypothetical protein